MMDCTWFFDSWGGLWISEPDPMFRDWSRHEPFGPVGCARRATPGDLELAFGAARRADESAWGAARRLGLYFRHNGWDHLNIEMVKKLRAEAIDSIPEYHRDTDLSSREAGELAARHVARVYVRLLERWARRE
jgi:hypothetical protein